LVALEEQLPAELALPNLPVAMAGVAAKNSAVAVVAVLAVQRRQAVLELQARGWALLAVRAVRAERHRVELEELVAHAMTAFLAPVARAAPVLSGIQLTAPVAAAVAVVIVVIPVQTPDLAALRVNTVQVVVEEEIRTAVQHQERGPQEAKELSRLSILPRREHRAA
jgi:hypothetical protein